jgi:hypothetical protein
LVEGLRVRAAVRAGCVIVTEVNGRAPILCLAACLGACQNLPEPYAPPEQRHPVEAPRPYRIDRVINMSDDDAPAHFVRDISPVLADSWRWTGKHPAIEVNLRANDGVRYVIDFTLPEVTFQATGPVTLSFYVNEHELGSVRYAEPGDKHFEKPVPQEWIPIGRKSTVAAEIDKTWTGPTDGNQLGFILTRIGLTQR